MNKKMLKSKMVLFDDNQNRLAAKLNLTIATLSHKLSGKHDWKLSEVKKIAEINNLDAQEVWDIFVKED